MLIKTTSFKARNGILIFILIALVTNASYSCVPIETVKTSTIAVATTETVTPPGLENIVSEAELKDTITKLFQENEGLYLTENDTAVWNTLATAMKSLYYKVTGTTLQENKFTIKILSQAEYKAESPIPNSIGTIRYHNDDGRTDILVCGQGYGAEFVFRVLSRETFNATAQKLNSSSKVTDLINSRDYLTSVLNDLSENPELNITPTFIENAKSTGTYVGYRLGEMFNSFGTSIIDAKLVELCVYDSLPPEDTQEYRYNIDEYADYLFNADTDGIKDKFLSDAILCEWYYALNVKAKSSAEQYNLFNQLLIKTYGSREGLESIVREMITTIRTAQTSGLIQQIKEASYAKPMPAKMPIDPYWLFEILPMT